jgi:hypothetical protein
MNLSPLPPSFSRISQTPAQPGIVTRRPAESAEGPGDAAASEPSLLEILTPEERAFFEQQMALGPLTYRAGRADGDRASAPTGRRIDVRG